MMPPADEKIIYHLVWLRQKVWYQSTQRSKSSLLWCRPECCSGSCLHRSCDMWPCSRLTKWKITSLFPVNIPDTFISIIITAYHLFTCYVTNAVVWSDQIGVWESVSQFHPVTVTVEVLQNGKGRVELTTIIYNNGIFFKNRIIKAFEILWTTCKGCSISPNCCLAAS